jgi:hypothetical protein
MTVKTYDRKSHELAKHFLSDEPRLNTAENQHSLALDIQQAVEDWFFDQTEKEKGDDL